MFLLLSAGAVVMFFWSPEPAADAVLSKGDDPAPRGGIAEVPLALDLLASLLDSGSSLAQGMAELARVCEGSLAKTLEAVSAGLLLGSEWDAVWSSFRRTQSGSTQQGLLRRLESGLRFAALTGAPSSALLRAAAERQRREEQREQERKAASLGVKLVLPMGLCALPVFICLGVVPLLLALLPGDIT